MPCEMDCPKRLKLLAVREKKRKCKEILAALCATYVMEPNRRDQTMYRINHVIAKYEKQETKITRICDDILQRCNLCYLYGA
jgi:hypothetical protein